MSDKPLNKKLTDKQETFCLEYIVDKNGKQAAIRAKYSEKTAEVQASRLLSNGKVAARVDELLAAAAKRNDITVDRVLSELARIAFLDPSDLLNADGSLKQINEMPEDARRAIGGLEISTRWEGGQGGQGDVKERVDLAKIKINDKGIALERLGKFLKMFTDKVEIEHKGEIHVFDVKDIRAYRKPDA